MVALAAWASQPAPLDGVWHATEYGKCLCDSRNFYSFEAGVITGYSSGHHSQLVGTYRPNGDGSYTVAMFLVDVVVEFTVVPRRFHWTVPPFEHPVNRRPYDRLFYRSTDPGLDASIIARGDRHSRVIFPYFYYRSAPFGKRMRIREWVDLKR